MKPVRLTMQAFGPYAGREVVDFREAVEAGLFGIYGQTGSGKSSIFSAMTFALFGQAAKAEQDAPSLRSDSADADLATEVEFVFDIGERRYVVRRRPEQRRPKQRGTGDTRDAHEAWLFDATGMALDAITLDQPGKVIEEKKVGPVGRAIEDLLGYGADQFRQIVLLPQGRFEAFLAADTKARLGILRDLFDVSLYRNLAARLKADAEAAEKQFREERAIFIRRLALDGFDTIEALQAGIDAAAEEHRGLVEAETARREDLKQAQLALDSARLVDGLFQTAAKATAELVALQQRGPEIDVLETRLRAAEGTRVLFGMEQQVTDARKDVSKEEAAHLVAGQRAAQAAQASDQAASTHQAETARAGEIEAMRREIEALGRHRQTLARTDEFAAMADTAARELATANQALDTSRARANTLNAQRQQQADRLKAARRGEGDRQSLQSGLSALEAALKLGQTAENAARDVATAEAEIERLQAAHATAEAAAAQADTIHAEAEQALAGAQALHLAGKLQAGEACPVCGATDHPALATGHVEHAGLDTVFRQTRQDAEKRRAAERAAHTQLVSARGIFGERQDRLAALQRPDRPVAELRAEIAEVTAALAALGPVIDIPAAEARLEALEAELVEADAARETQRAAVEQAGRAAATSRATLETMLADIPTDRRDLGKLDAGIAQLQQTVAQRETALRKAGEAASATRDAALATAKDLEAATERLADRQARLATAHASFARHLTEAGLSDAQYQALKPAVATIARDREMVETFRRGLHSAQETDRRAREAIADRARPDLAPALEAVATAEEAQRLAQSRSAAAAARLAQLEKLRDELDATARRLQQAEEETGPLRELAALVDSKNPLNLDLETFAIGAMFDQVLLAANQRLGPMSGHRYSLERAVEGAGRSRRGLGIQVHDTHTGKARPTATLSGGESFIAALALALGLADVVESANGRVRLDTIFIDEGFGSLDSENGAGTLDQVLQALNGLVSQNRAVGLISHVPLVQEAIPNGFYIRKELSGSRVEQRGLL